MYLLSPPLDYKFTRRKLFCFPLYASQNPAQLSSERNKIICSYTIDFVPYTYITYSCFFLCNVWSVIYFHCNSYNRNKSNVVFKIFFTSFRCIINLDKSSSTHMWLWTLAWKPLHANYFLDFFKWIWLLLATFYWALTM